LVNHIIEAHRRITF
jgi:hypothetical protein